LLSQMKGRVSAAVMMKPAPSPVMIPARAILA
jgi:hypothetical protein